MAIRGVYSEGEKDVSRLEKIGRQRGVLAGRSNYPGDTLLCEFQKYNQRSNRQLGQ